MRYENLKRIGMNFIFMWNKPILFVRVAVNSGMQEDFRVFARNSKRNFKWSLQNIFPAKWF